MGIARSDSGSNETDSTTKVEIAASSRLPRRTYDCVYCRRGFNKAQALGGHMNIHRRDRDPSKATKIKRRYEEICYQSCHPYSGFAQQTDSSSFSQIRTNDMRIGDINMIFRLEKNSCSNEKGYPEMSRICEDGGIDLELRLG